MAKASEELHKLDGKEGKLLELVKEFLDLKGAKYTVAKAEPGIPAVYMKGVEPFVEEGSIVIEKDRKKIIIEELTKVCGISGRFHDRDGVDIDVTVDRAKRIVFKTFKGSKDLSIYTDMNAKEPTFGLSLGSGMIKTKIKDILNKAEMHESDETYEINCDCHGVEGLKCKGKTWEY